MPSKVSKQKLAKNAAKAEEAERQKREEEEAARAEYKKNGPAIDPELEWSDDEHGEKDWTVKSPAKKKTYARDDDMGNVIPDERVTVQPKVFLKENSEDYKRAKLKLKGDTFDKERHAVRGILPREVRVPQYVSYKLPIPILPAHVMQSIGPDVLEHLWYEFLQHGVNKNHFIKLSKLKKISPKVEAHVGFPLPFDELRFRGMEKADLVKFEDICAQLVLVAESRNTTIRRPPMWIPPVALPSCCAVQSCDIENQQHVHEERLRINERHGHSEHKHQSKEKEKEKKKETQIPARRARSGAEHMIAEKEIELEVEEEVVEEEEDDEDNVDTHAFRVAYVSYKLQQRGNLRLKHIPIVMEMARIPYEKSRLPSKVWDLRGEFLVTTCEEAITTLMTIRTDLDEEERTEKDPLYVLPLWMENEFKPSEIMLFKHHFKSIDIDAGGDIDEYELMGLTKSLGAAVTLEESLALIDIMDLDGGGTVSFDEFMMLMYKIQNGVIDLGDNMLAKSMIAAKSQIAIFEEIEENMRDPVDGTRIRNYGGTPVGCDIDIDGPAGSLYEGGVYRLRIEFLDGYPYKIPTIKFQTRLYHCNVMIQFDGDGYLPHIFHLWDRTWGIRKLLEHVKELMRQPQQDLVPVEMIDIIKVFLMEQLADAQQADAERRAQIYEEQEEERLAEEARQAELARLKEDDRLADLNAVSEMKVMAGEDPMENGLEMENMAKEDFNHAAELDWEEEEALRVQGLENRRVAEEERLVQEEQDQLDEEERLRVEAEEVEAERLRRELEMNEGADPLLALLGDLIGGDDKDSATGGRGPNSDQLKKNIGRQEQMHLTTVQMYMFERERYNGVAEAYRDGFAKKFCPSSEEEGEGKGGAEGEGEGEEADTEAVEEQSMTSVTSVSTKKSLGSVTGSLAGVVHVLVEPNPMNPEPEEEDLNVHGNWWEKKDVDGNVIEDSSDSDEEEDEEQEEQGGFN